MGGLSSFWLCPDCGQSSHDADGCPKTNKAAPVEHSVPEGYTWDEEAGMLRDSEGRLDPFLSGY